MYFGHRVDVKSRTCYFSESELSATGVENTILTISNEDAEAQRIEEVKSQENFTSLTVNKRLPRRTSAYEDATVLTAVNLHLLAIIHHY